MSVLQVLFPILTIVLAVACFACYRTSKPLREKAKAEAREKLEKERQAAKQARERLARDELRIDILTDIEAFINDPYRPTRSRSQGDHMYSVEPRFKLFHEFVMKVKGLQHQRDEVKELEGRISTQSRLIRELQMQQREIIKALQLGQPVDF